MFDNSRFCCVIVRRRTTSILAVFAAASALFSAGAQAAPIGYTDPAAFFAALPSAANIADFEGVPAGNATDTGLLIADGGSLNGITFHYPDLAGFGISLEVRDDFDALSGANYLGTDDGGVLQNIDDLAFSFASSNAFGLFILTGDTLFDGDVTLTAGGLSVGLNIADALPSLSDGTLVYFLGIVDVMATFGEASLASFRDPPDCDTGCFLFNIDDIITTGGMDPTPVPIPAAWMLMALGLAAAKIPVKAGKPKRKASRRA